MSGINSYAKFAKYSIAALWAVFALSVLVLVICQNLGIKGAVMSSSGVLCFALGLPLLGTIRYFYDVVDMISKQYGVTLSNDVRRRIAPLAAHLDARVEIGFYPSDDANAFAISSVFGGKALIAFSSGLLEAADDSRLRAIAAHEIAHLKNGDSRNKTFILAFSHAVRTYPYLLSELSKELLRKTAIMLAIFAGIFLVIIFPFVGNELGGMQSICKPILLVMAWPAGVILAYLILNHLLNRAFFAYSREREFVADADGAMMTSHQDMISALSLLAENEEGAISVFDTHPPLKERIKRLRNEAASCLPDDRVLEPTSS